MAHHHAHILSYLPEYHHGITIVSPEYHPGKWTLEVDGSHLGGTSSRTVEAEKGRFDQWTYRCRVPCEGEFFWCCTK